MNKKQHIQIILIIYVVTLSFMAVIVSFWSNSQQYLEKNDDYIEDKNGKLLRLFILGIIDNELSIWVIGTERRIIVLETMHEKMLIKASDIADSTGRSLQNISCVIRELEKKGLVKCITPEKYTWKRYFLTEKGRDIYSDIKKNGLI